MAQRVRKNILNLSDTERDKLIEAWRNLQAKLPDDPNGFFVIAGYHGQPFRGPGYGKTAWWGGYCHHGNVLFPTWHRAYLLCLEDALRRVPGCENVTLPYWNQMQSEGSGDNERVVPRIFTDKTYTFSTGGAPVPNPLYSYKLARGFSDRLSRPGVDYGKPTGYETVRYPLSGLVGSGHKRKTDIHNTRTRKFTDAQITGFLNENVRNWFNDRYEPPVLVPGLRTKYKNCLDANNYTIFSNTTSATKWNDDHAGTERLAVSLESPHNGTHLAVGGYDMPDRPSFDGANGDMGENDTAAFDPIFFFHHCFIDRVFWAWQERHRNVGVDGVEIIPEYPGTSPVDDQGPTPGIAAHSWLTITTPLHPFKKSETEVWTSQDMARRASLPYAYDNLTISSTETSSLESLSLSGEPFVGHPKKLPPYLRISNIDRSTIAGSFIISAWAKKPGESEEAFVGCEPVFSRRNVSGCANCNNHLKVTAYIPLGGFPKDFIDNVSFGSRVGTSDGRGGLEIEGGEHTVTLMLAS